MLKPEKYGNFKPLGKNREKTQIILCHTSREVGEYLTSLKFRYNGKYDRIPNFIITKTGEILQLLDEKGYTNFFGEETINKKAIFISLENLGWLEKKPLTGHYINWNESIYKGKVFEKKWRDYFFWEPYNEEQIIKLGNFCSELCDHLQIPKTCVGHNTKIDGMTQFEGICSRSNYDTRFTDLSPSFDFEILIKNIENEQHTQREIR
jgi:N-acetyl-anhydromuramyl-L-alanine amidase AmpD